MEQWNFDYYDNSHLSHHGIKGMRWGIRRFQRRDGSLTPKGEKRRTLRDAIHDRKVKKKRKAALEKARATKQANKEAAEKAAKDAEKRKMNIEKGRISAKNMTNEELQYMMARKQLEKQYHAIDLETNVGKRFLNNAWNNTVEPALLNAGKNVLQKYVEKTVSDALGINAKSALEKAKEAADISNYQKQSLENKKAIEKLKNGESDEDKLYNMLKRESEITKFQSDIAKNRSDIDKYKNGKPEDEELAKAKREADLAKNRKNAYKDTRDYEEMKKRYEGGGNSGGNNSGGSGGNNSGGNNSGGSGGNNSGGNNSGGSGGNSGGNNSGGSSGSNGGSNSHNYGSSGSSTAQHILNGGYKNTRFSNLLSSSNSETERGSAWIESASGEWLTNTTWKDLSDD